MIKKFFPSLFPCILLIAVLFISYVDSTDTHYQYIEVKPKIEWMGVLWFGKEIKNYPYSIPMPRRFDIIFGLRDDGTVVWKKVKIKNPKNEVK